MEKQTVHVLVLDGKIANTLTVSHSLVRAAHFHFEITQVKNLAEALGQVKPQRFGVAVMELDSDAGCGIDALRSLHQAAPELPVIIVADDIDEILMSRAISMGAQDCVRKGRINEDLVRAIDYAIRRKQVDEALTSERTLLRSLIDHLPSLIFFKDKAGRYVVSNKAHTRFLGAKEEAELLGKTVFDFFPPPLARLYQADDLSLAQTGEAILEKEMPEQVGDKLVWYSITKVPLKDAKGKISGLIGIKQDITDRKQTEASLRKAEERYRSIFENAVEGIFQSTPEGRYITVNPAFARILGYDSPTEVIARCTDIGRQVYVNPQDREKFKTQLAKEGVVVGLEHEAYRKDRTKVWTSLNGRAIRNPDGTIKYYEGSIEDITERKRAELEIQHLAAFPQHNPNPVYEFAPDGTLKYANDAAATLSLSLGAKQASDILPETAVEIVRECWTEGRNKRRLETQHGIRTISWSFFPIRAVGTVHCYAGEITEIKRAQEALRQSEERYHLAMRGLSAGLWDWNILTNEIFFAPRFKMLLGYAEDEFPAESRSIQSLSHPEDAEKLQKALNAHLSSEAVPYELDCRLQMKDGQYRWFHICGLALRGQHGTPYRMAGSITDITERKQDEELLRISEERFRLLAKATNDAIWDWDLITNRVWWSEGFEYLFGYRREEVEPTAESWTKRIHPDDYKRVSDDIYRVIGQGGNSWTGEYRFLCRNGTYTYVHDYGSVIRNGQGVAIRMIGGMSDLSDRKAAEEKLARQAALLDQAKDAIIVKDLDDRIIYWNQSAMRTYGWKSEEVIGRTSRDLIHIDGSRFAEAKEELLRKGHFTGEMRKRTKDGCELLVETRWSLMRNAFGQPSFILSINTDVTEKRKLEQQFLRAQRMESIGTLAGGMAHDLNNTLTPVLMGINLLKEEVSSEEGLETLETMETSLQRGASLIRQVLSFARGIKGKRDKIDLRQIIQEIRQLIDETFPKSIVCKITLPSDAWTITGDTTNLHQVILNLCVNARDAMTAGGILSIMVENRIITGPSARLNAESSPGAYVVIEVGDTGTGIPEEIRHKIFEPFFSTKELSQGTGLGLSTSLGIVKSHHGFITVDSELGKGSTFRVHLPAAPAEAQTELSTNEEKPIPSGEGRLILIVDDEDAIRWVAGKILTSGGYTVLEAGNGAEAVTLYTSRVHMIAAVITDMTMPVMDGPALVAELKSMNPQVKLIGMSGQGSANGKTRALHSGMNAFLPKPFTADSLLKTVHEVISRKA